MQEYESNIVSQDTVGNKVTEDWHSLQASAKKEFLDTHKTELLDSDITIFPKPKKSCTHCYGRGFEGAIITPKSGKDINLCRCIRNRIGRQEVECLTYGEFRAILDHCNSIFNLGGNYEISKSENVSEVIQGSNQKDVGEGNAVEQGTSGNTSEQEVGHSEAN